MMNDPNILIAELNYFKPYLDQAIKLTEQYISDNKLILTGGMAIDLALRNKGQSIYSDDEIPDYDIISDHSIDHANALAEMLCKHEIPNITVINAVHITTVRVRMKNTTLLDATYIPPHAFVRIPYLDVGRLRVVHPHYQMIDQRLSLSLMLQDTGLSLNVFNRLKKDMERNMLLRSEYPIESSDRKPPMHRVSIPLALIGLDEKKRLDIDDVFVYMGKACVAGYIGIALMMHTIDPIGFPIEVDTDSISLPMPKDIPIRILTHTIDSFGSDMVNPQVFRPLLNLKPTTIVSGGYEFVDTYGSRIGCNILDVMGKHICVASVDYLIMELLRDRIYVSQEPYSTLYHTLIEATDKQQSSSESDSIWWPTLNSYGIDDLPEHKVFMMQRILDPDTSKSLRPPISYLFHPTCAARSGFDATKSQYFMIDGMEDPTIEHYDHRYIVDEFEAFAAKKRRDGDPTRL